MKIKPEELKEFVENNPKLVTRKESKTYPGLFVLKYARSVFYDHKWGQHELIKECRGLIVDADYNVVIRPFTKIYNYLEEGAGKTWGDNSLLLITKKINGFMAAATNVNGKLIVSTTGSLDSDFVGYAKTYLDKLDVNTLALGFTYMFEIVHPDDPHIIPEEIGAHFLAVVSHDDGETSYKFDFMVKVIDDALIDFESTGIILGDDEHLSSITKFSELKEMGRQCKHEGFVAVNVATGETLKMKSPYYLASKALARKADIFKLNKEFIDEEYHDLVDHLKKMESWVEMEEQDRLEFIRNYFNSIV
jgi:hypothetical protein